LFIKRRLGFGVKGNDLFPGKIISGSFSFGAPTLQDILISQFYQRKIF
jgi:hypothetical protein